MSGHAGLGCVSSYEGPGSTAQFLGDEVTISPRPRHGAQDDIGATKLRVSVEGERIAGFIGERREVKRVHAGQQGEGVACGLMLAARVADKWR